MGLNETPPSNEEIKKLFRLPQPGLPKEVSDESISAFFRGVPVAPESTNLSGISQGAQLTPVINKPIKEEKVESGLLDTPLPITLGGSTLGKISIRQALKIVEPILGVIEVPIELMRQKFRDASVVRNKIKSGELPSISDVSKIFFGNPKTLIDAIKKVPKTGSVFRELTKPDGVSKEDRFSDFSEVLEEIGVPSGPNISPFEKFPVSLRGAAGFGLEILTPVPPLIKGIKVGGGVVSKIAKRTGKLAKKIRPAKEIIPEAKKIIPGAQVSKQTPTKVAPEVQKAPSKPVSTGGRVIVPETVVDDAKIAILDKKGKIVTGRPEQHHSQIHERLFVEERTNIRPGIDDASDITGWEYKGQFISIKDLEKTKGDFRKAFQDKFDKLEVITSKPVSTGEAIKLPKETSIKNALTSADREAFNLSTLSSPERLEFARGLKDAKEGGFHKKALRTAEEIIENPRELTPRESSGMAVRMVELKTEYTDLSKKLNKATNGSAEQHDFAVTMERVKEEFDKITEAGKRGGSVSAQNLVFRKLTLNEDFDLLSVETRATAAKVQGKKNAVLTTKEKSKLKELTEKLADREKQVAELEKEVSRRTANAVLKRSKGTKKFAKMSRVERDAVLESTVAKARKLIDEGCIISG